MLGREKIKPASKQEKEGPIISGYYWENRDEPDYIPSSKALDVAAELAKVRRSLQETPDEEVLDGEESKKNISSQRREAEIDIDRRKVLTGFLGLTDAYKQGLSGEVKENNEDRKEEGITRRKFLKRMGEATVALPLSWATARYYGLIDSAKNILGFSQKEEIIEVEPEEKEEESVEPKVTFEWSKRNEEEVRTIQEIIKFSPQERIKFGEKEFNDLYKHHFHRLNNETDQKPELEKSYSQIQPWLEIKGEESIGNIFQREFIDKLAEKEKITDEEKEKLYYTYIALIIRESGGDPRALSPAGAAGMHQFMKSTGHEYHLQQNYNIDERFDPIKSATACANYLYELYNDYKSGDTSLEEGMCLTLHAYNGIVGNYVKEVQEKNEAGIDEKVTYQGYLRFIETEINNERDKIMRNNSLSQAEKEKAFNKAMKGYVENMNYVPYIMAARDTLLETAKQGELPTKKERIIVDRHMEAKKVQEARVIKIQQGDTISSLAKRHGVKPTKILKLNPDLKVKKMGGKVIVRLRVGQPLIIEGAEHTTLLRLAKGNGKVLNDLITLNPQIINFRKEIPDGTKIRIGKMIESA